MSDQLSAGDLIDRLALRYPREKAWALFTEVANRDGRSYRYTDALVVNFSTSALTLEGFEIKVSRSDWLNELRQPEKAMGGLLPHVHRWWVVAGSKDVVRESELPDGWGLILPRGATLAAKVQARTVPEPRPLDAYVCSVLIRHAYDRLEFQKLQAVNAEVEKRIEDRLAIQKRELNYREREVQRLTEERDSLRTRCKLLDAMGLDLEDEEVVSLAADDLRPVARLLMGLPVEADRMKHVVSLAERALGDQRKRLDQAERVILGLKDGHAVGGGA